MVNSRLCLQVSLITIAALLLASCTHRGGAPSAVALETLAEDAWTCRYKIRIQPKRGRVMSFNARFSRQGAERRLNLYGPMGSMSFTITEAADGEVNVSNAAGRWRTDNLPPKLARMLETVRYNLRIDKKYAKNPSAATHPLHPIPSLAVLEQWLWPNRSSLSAADDALASGWVVDYPNAVASAYGNYRRIHAAHAGAQIRIAQKSCSNV